jgi:Holliday junction resolvase RusA-like endonuclease
MMSRQPIAFIVVGPPACKGSVVAFRAPSGRIVTKTDSKHGKTWAKHVAYCAVMAGLPVLPKGIGVRVEAEYQFTAPIRGERGTPCVRPDVDKLARALLDALTGIAYEDDGQVVSLTVRKVYGPDTLTRVWVDRT